MNSQSYAINIRHGWGIPPTVKVSQYDVGRPLAFVLMDGQEALTIASGTTVKIEGTKPSGLGFSQACELDGNTATINTVATMTQEAGAIPCELVVSVGSTTIGTANFNMMVELSAHPDGTTDGDAETAKDLMTRAEEAVVKAEAAAEAISQAGIDTTGSTAGQVPTANGNGGWSWADQEGGGGSTSDDITNESTVSGATVTDALSSLYDQIANVQGGAPTPVSTVSGMVDTSKIYLYTGSEAGYNAGHWYYYSNGSWVDGGAYGEAASMSAGVKAALLACFQKVAWIDENGQTYYENLYNELYSPASLVSITAVYTQSGTVYDTASLDDLKPDLVVTANFSDGTSQTVTTYTLNGTLAVGTNTVIVTYNGKTTTFSVTVSTDDRFAVTYRGNFTTGTESTTRVTIITGELTLLQGETLTLSVGNGYKVFPINENGSGTREESRTASGSANTIYIYAVNNDSGYIYKKIDHAIGYSGLNPKVVYTPGSVWTTSSITYTINGTALQSITFDGIAFYIEKTDGSDITIDEAKNAVSWAIA